MTASVTQAQIDKLLDDSQTQEHVFWGKELVVSYRLPCGFTILGRAACVDPANFDLEIGRKFARENAANQLWQLEGYRLQLEVGPLESTSELQKPLTEREQALFFVGLLTGSGREEEAVDFCSEHKISLEIAQKAIADIDEFTDIESWKQTVTT